MQSMLRVYLADSNIVGKGLADDDSTACTERILVSFSKYLTTEIDTYKQRAHVVSISSISPFFIQIQNH